MSLWLHSFPSWLPLMLCRPAHLYLFSTGFALTSSWISLASLLPALASVSCIVAKCLFPTQILLTPLSAGMHSLDCMASIDSKSRGFVQGTFLCLSVTLLPQLSASRPLSPLLSSWLWCSDVGCVWHCSFPIDLWSLSLSLSLLWEQKAWLLCLQFLTL